MPREDDFVKIIDLQKFANRIKEDKPYSYSMYNTLLLHARGLSSMYEFYTHKDNLEDSHIIISKNKDPSSPQEMFLFHCLQEEKSLILQALRETELVNWYKGVFFAAVPEFLAQDLQNILEVKSEPEANILNFPGSMYKYSPGVEVKCPAGFNVEKLGDAGLHTLFNAWHYKDFNHANISWFSSIAENGLSCGIYKSQKNQSYDPEIENLPTARDDEVPVSWITFCPYGQLGLLETEAGYRRLGLGGLVTQVTAQVAEKEGYFAQVCVLDYNDQSQRMFQRLGWKNSYKVSWLIKTIKKDDTK